MSGTVDPNDWRTWPRNGEFVVPPPGTSGERCIQVMWEMSCEVYGIDPENPPPIRKDILRIVRRPSR
jgi:hypothetical protein